MKKYIVLFMLCSMLLCFLTGCAEVLESSLELRDNMEEEADIKIGEGEDLLYTEEGYYVIEGKFCEMDKNTLFVEVENDRRLCFKLSPETIIYAGDSGEISEGQAVKIVFDGEMVGESIENVTVIAITLLEE